jgi:simple sugar transport system ATP-binding protein
MLLKMKNIHKFFGEVHALKGVNFHVDSGEVVGLVGDNGAGKSTLMGILNGSISKSRGTIYWKGKEVVISSVKDARELGIEMVYQDQALVDAKTVAENIFLGREPMKSFGLIKIIDRGEMRKKAREITESLGLKIASPDQEVRFCSGGEREGVAIARALLFRAELVILDEPTNALSVKGVEKVLNFIKQLRDEGIACIVISHNLEHVYPVSDRIVMLDRGKKVMDVRKEKISLERLKETQRTA